MQKKRLNWFLINENYGANLYPFAIHFDADYHGFKKAFGRGMEYQAVGTENGFLRQAYVVEDYDRFAQFIFDRMSTDKGFTRRMLRNIYRAIEKMHELDRRILSQDLQRLNNAALGRLFLDFYKRYWTVSTWSVPFSFSEYRTLLWTTALTSYFQALKIPKQYTSLEVYQLLTSHWRKTYTAREHERALHLAAEVRGSQKLSRLFRLPVNLLKRHLKKEHKRFFEKVVRHVSQYEWINFNFEGPLLHLDYFLAAIKDAAAKNPKRELQSMKRSFRTLRSRQRSMVSALHVDAYHRWIIWIVREFGFQKAYRKDIEYYSNFAYEALLREFGRRFSITVTQGHYLLLNEVLGMLDKEKRVSEHQLNQRITFNFYVVTHGKARLLVGVAARKFAKGIKSASAPKGLKKLTGQCACRGHVRGVVKIINGKSDYASFRDGDILVSWATNPNMIPLMKRAAAIVTDEGGVTCHAAIVSRELNIPCIIGTRFATKVFKNGQRVDVDATRGIVKKLS